MLNQLLPFIGKTIIGLDARDLRCFCQIILAIIRERTVNLVKLSLHCQYKSRRTEACYRRIQRFITRCPITQHHVASFIMTFFEGSQLLAMDRTNWAFGTFEINILVLSVVYKGYSFPLFWTLLDHKGCSSPKNRQGLMEIFIKNYGVKRIQALLLDREFIGREWLSFLSQAGITFHVRLKSNIKIHRGKGELCSPQCDFAGLKILEKLDLPGLRRLGVKKDGMKLFVSVTRSKDNALVIVASNSDQDQALDRYKLRWGIETLFGCLKTRGFCFEDTHLKDKHKVSHLLVLLAFAFFWAFRMGEWLHEKAPIQLKTHKRKAVSFFRYGLNALIRAEESFHEYFLVPLSSIPLHPPPKKLLLSLGYL